MQKITSAPKKRAKKLSVYEIVFCAILIVYSLILLLVFAWALINSFKTAPDFKRNSLGLPKEGWQFSNYTKALEAFYVSGSDGLVYGFFDMFGTSLLYAGGSAFFQTACTVIAAYCTSKYKSKTSSFTYGAVLVVIALPIVGGTASLIQVTQALGIYDTVWGMWIVKFGFCSMYYLILYSVFDSLSWEYAESAFVDGASHYTVFFRIMLPLVMGLVGTVFLLLFIGYWNDFEVPYIFLEQPTLSIGLYAVLNGWAVDANNQSIRVGVPQQMVAGIAVFMPIFIVFILFRNKIMGNLTEGGIKA